MDKKKVMLVNSGVVFFFLLRLRFILRSAGTGQQVLGRIVPWGCRLACWLMRVVQGLFFC